MRGGSRQSAFRPDIEGLRGIAVLLVVLFHCGVPGLPGGFIGVDVFFVLSGYLITGLLVKEVQKTTRIHLLQFYARRMRRLLPASALTLVVTLGLGIAILAPAELVFAGRAARATALYMSNVFFGINAADYFAPNVESNPMLHTWSLAVEEQFYFVWPLLIVVGLQVLRSRTALWALLSGVTVVSLGVSVWSTAHAGTFAFYQLPARAWEFGLGGLAALSFPGAIRMRPGGWLALGWLGIGLIVGSAHFISSGVGFPGWVALVPVIGTVAALFAGSELPELGVGRFLNSAPLQMLGALSYSWYLWHWPFLVLGKAFYPDISVGGRIGLAAASLILAAITHHLIENPIRFHPYLVEKPVRSICCGVAITLVSLSAASFSMKFGDRISNTPEMKRVTASIGDIARMPRQQCVSLGDSPEVKSCVFGDPSANTSIVLFGDSHAIQWFNPLQRMAETHRWKLTTVVKSGCPAADMRDVGSTAGFATACNEWRSEAIRRIIGMRPAAVFVGNSSAYLRGDNLAVSLDHWRDGARRTLEALTGVGLQVGVMRDNPQFPFDVPTCLARAIRHSYFAGGACEMSESVVLNPAIFQAERVAAQGLPNVHFIDLTDQFCQHDVCNAVVKGDIMYRDDNHLTGTFADHLMPVLEDRFLPVLNSR